MASRKQEREKLRQERERAQAAASSSERKRLFLGYGVAGVITLLVVVGIVFLVTGGGSDGGSSGGAGGDRLNEAFGIQPEGVLVDDRESTPAPTNGALDLQEAADAASCELLLDQKDEGSTHVADVSELPDYKTNPPSSGDHFPDPLADGAFSTAPGPENYIHALEHGRIEIQYLPSLAEEAQLELLGLYDEDPAGMIVFPNPDLPFEVGATAWTQTLACDSYDGATTLDAIRAFRDEFRARGPEPIAMG